MTLHNIPDADFNLDLARGVHSKFSIVNKFGRNKLVGTSFAPISIGGVYQTPQVSGATTLRVKAGDANDTANGTGARSVTLVGLNASGQEVTETIATNGASAGAAGGAGGSHGGGVGMNPGLGGAGGTGGNGAIYVFTW